MCLIPLASKMGGELLLIEYCLVCDMLSPAIRLNVIRPIANVRLTWSLLEELEASWDLEKLSRPENEASTTLELETLHPNYTPLQVDLFRFKFVPKTRPFEADHEPMMVLGV